MIRRTTTLIAIALVAGCHAGVPQEVLREYQSRQLYTCCNIHYEADEITDANYFVGSTIPAGTPARVEEVRSDSITFVAGGKKLTVYHSYGTEQESSREYFDKILVPADPKARVAGSSRAVREAIGEGRVERGMTREQVLVSLGYPPTHRTPSLSAGEWTYWYNRWATYKVVFDANGIVSSVVGSPAPTRGQPVN